MPWTRTDATQARLLLRVIRAAALTDGIVSTQEEALAATMARFLGVEPALDAPPLDLAELTEAKLEGADATRLVQAAILTALMDGEVDPSEAHFVRALAERLGVDEPRVRNIEQLAKGRVRLMWLDLARRSFAREVFEGALRDAGPSGVWKIVGPMLGGARDAALAQRYLALGELPEDTLGYAYFRFIVEEELGFPGEPYSVPESGTWHDIAHVLGGYGTEPPEEVQVVSFIAGFSREDPFFWLFTIALQFHLGIRVSPYSPSREGLFVPEKVIGAYERGAAMNTDLSAPGWDPWRWFPEKLENVRSTLGVPPP